MRNDIYFVAETEMSSNGRKLKTLTPDEDGFFKGLPMAVLGIPTRNNTQYDSNSLIDAIDNPQTTFNRRLKDAELFGEYGHPFTYKPLSDPKTSVRVLGLNPEKKAVLYRKFYCKRDTEQNLDMIYADLKPMGPYAKYAEEQLLDPSANFSSSLRAISSQEKRGNILFRRVMNLITFDVCVPGGGFQQASKRYQDASFENFAEIMDHDTMAAISNNAESIAMEGLLTDTELNDIFKKSNIKIGINLKCFRIDKDIIHIQGDDKNHCLEHLVSKLV